MQIRKLDFSIFHPLDHWPFTAECRSWPGGTRRHLSDTWHYRRREQLQRPFYKLFCCTRGKHQWMTWHALYTDTYWTKCKFCDAFRDATPEEIEEFNR